MTSLPPQNNCRSDFLTGTVIYGRRVFSLQLPYALRGCPPPPLTQEVAAALALCVMGVKGQMSYENVVYEIKCKLCGNLHIGKPDA